MSKRAIGYLRVSTTDQATDGVSLEAQRERVRAWCGANDYRLDDADVFVDPGLSGKRADNRPGLQAALDAVCKRRGALVVYSLSRLARSTKDAIGIAERLDKAGADFVSLTESIDTTTAAGKMIFRMLAVLAEFERDLVSERTRAALAHKRKNGERISRYPPFGWRFEDKSDDDTAKLVELPEEQRVITEIRDMRAAGHSYRRIATELSQRGIPTKAGRAAWTHQSVRSIVLRDST